MSGDLPDAAEWLERLEVGLTWTDDPNIEEAIYLLDPPSMLLRQQDEREAERWAIFHGLGHLALHRGSQLWLLRVGQRHTVWKQEAQAERWAAEQLLPAAELERVLHAGMEAPELAEHFMVPLAGAELAVRLFTERLSGTVTEGDQEIGFHFVEGRQPWPMCAFCESRALNLFETGADNVPPGFAQRSPLCREHERLLYDAGDRGRVFAGDGVRYWLLER